MTVGDETPDGVMLSQGGRFGGWAAWLDKGVPVFTYNYLAMDEFTIRGSNPLPQGKNEIVFDFAYDKDNGVGQGGMMKISVGGKSVGKGRLERTQPFVMSTESTGVGHDGETPVVEAYGSAPDNEFRGGNLGAIRITRSK